MKWTIKTYIPVENDDPNLFDNPGEAEREIRSQSLMQPENIYVIEEVEE